MVSGYTNLITSSAGGITKTYAINSSGVLGNLTDSGKFYPLSDYELSHDVTGLVRNASGQVTSYRLSGADAAQAAAAAAQKAAAETAAAKAAAAKAAANAAQAIDPQKTSGYTFKVTLSHADQNNFINAKKANPSLTEYQWRKAHGKDLSVAKGSYVAPKYTSGSGNNSGTGTAKVVNKSTGQVVTKSTSTTKGVSNTLTGTQKFAAQSKVNPATNVPKVVAKTTVAKAVTPVKVTTTKVTTPVKTTPTAIKASVVKPTTSSLTKTTTVKSGDAKIAAIKASSSVNNSASAKTGTAQTVKPVVKTTSTAKTSSNDHYGQVQLKDGTWINQIEKGGITSTGSAKIIQKSSYIPTAQQVKSTGVTTTGYIAKIKAEQESSRKANEAAKAALGSKGSVVLDKSGNTIQQIQGSGLNELGNRITISTKVATESSKKAVSNQYKSLVASGRTSGGKSSADLESTGVYTRTKAQAEMDATQYKKNNYLSLSGVGLRGDDSLQKLLTAKATKGTYKDLEEFKTADQVKAEAKEAKVQKDLEEFKKAHPSKAASALATAYYYTTDTEHVQKGIDVSNKQVASKLTILPSSEKFASSVQKSTDDSNVAINKLYTALGKPKSAEEIITGLTEVKQGVGDFVSEQYATVRDRPVSAAAGVTALYLGGEVFGVGVGALKGASATGVEKVLTTKAGAKVADIIGAKASRALPVIPGIIADTVLVADLGANVGAAAATGYQNAGGSGVTSSLLKSGLEVYIGGKGFSRGVKFAESGKITDLIPAKESIVKSSSLVSEKSESLGGISQRKVGISTKLEPITLEEMNGELIAKRYATDAEIKAASESAKVQAKKSNIDVGQHEGLKDIKGTEGKTIYQERTPAGFSGTESKIITTDKSGKLALKTRTEPRYGTQLETHEHGADNPLVLKEYTTKEELEIAKSKGLKGKSSGESEYQKAQYLGIKESKNILVEEEVKPHKLIKSQPDEIVIEGIDESGRLITRRPPSEIIKTTAYPEMETFGVKPKTVQQERITPSNIDLSARKIATTDGKGNLVLKDSAVQPKVEGKYGTQLDVVNTGGEVLLQTKNYASLESMKKAKALGYERRASAAKKGVAHSEYEATRHEGLKVDSGSTTTIYQERTPVGISGVESKYITKDAKDDLVMKTRTEPRYGTILETQNVVLPGKTAEKTLSLKDYATKEELEIAKSQGAEYRNKKKSESIKSILGVKKSISSKAELIEAKKRGAEYRKNSVKLTSEYDSSKYQGLDDSKLVGASENTIQQERLSGMLSGRNQRYGTVLEVANTGMENLLVTKKYTTKAELEAAKAKGSAYRVKAKAAGKPGKPWDIWKAEGVPEPVEKSNSDIITSSLKSQKPKPTITGAKLTMDERARIHVETSTVESAGDISTKPRSPFGSNAKVVSMKYKQRVIKEPKYKLAGQVDPQPKYKPQNPLDATGRSEVIVTASERTGKLKVRENYPQYNAEGDIIGKRGSPYSSNENLVKPKYKKGEVKYLGYREEAKRGNGLLMMEKPKEPVKEIILREENGKLVMEETSGKSFDPKKGVWETKVERNVKDVSDMLGKKRSMPDFSRSGRFPPMQLFGVFQGYTPNSNPRSLKNKNIPPLGPSSGGIPTPNGNNGNVPPSRNRGVPPTNKKNRGVPPTSGGNNGVSPTQTNINIPPINKTRDIPIPTTKTPVTIKTNTVDVTKTKPVDITKTNPVEITNTVNITKPTPVTIISGVQVTPPTTPTPTPSESISDVIAPREPQKWKSTTMFHTPNPTKKNKNETKRPSGSKFGLFSTDKLVSKTKVATFAESRKSSNSMKTKPTASSLISSKKSNLSKMISGSKRR